VVAAPLHVAAAAAITAPIMHIPVAVRRIGSVRRLSLALWPLDATDKGQRQEHRGEPSMQIHQLQSVPIRLGSLFLTLPARALTAQQGSRARATL
jgi:hypothetical protein